MDARCLHLAPQECCLAIASTLRIALRADRRHAHIAKVIADIVVVCAVGPVAVVVIGPFGHLVAEHVLAAGGMPTALDSFRTSLIDDFSMGKNYRFSAASKKITHSQTDLFERIPYRSPI